MDIDKRAYQLAYFAVMMKARSYNRRVLTKCISNNLAVVEESNSIDKFTCNGLTTDSEQNKIGEYLVEAYRDAQEIGTLQTIEKKDYKEFAKYLNNVESSAGQIDLFSTAWLNDTLPQMVQLAKQAEIMSNKYAVVCTNPPYMNKLEGQLKKFVVDNYKAYSGDLFSVFIYRNFDYCKIDGYSAFMTPFVWLFIKTYEALRTYIIDSKAITTLVQMEYSAFEEATVPICSFVLKNGKAIEKVLCFRLSDFKGGMEVQKQKVLEAIGNKNCDYFFETEQNGFSKIPSSPIAYWVSEKMKEAFSNELLYDKSISPSQNVTGNNSKYVRKFWELSNNKIGGVDDWIFYCKGGGYRKWWGNLEDVVDWSPSAREIYQYGDGKHASQIINKDYWYRKGITWGLITSALPSFRVMPEGATYDKGGSTIIVDENVYYFTLALLNSKVYLNIASMLNPTLNFQVKDVRSMPLVLKNADSIEKITEDNIAISKRDWDSFETSWNFRKHPLISYAVSNVSMAFEMWSKDCDEHFNQLKANEEEVNRIFIDIYGLQDELTPEVEDKDVTVRKADLQRDIKSLISYAVGCMFGRYSLEREGIVYAGGNFDDVFWKYKGQAALDKNGEAIEGSYAGISLADYHYPKFHDTDDWKTATELSFEPDVDNCIPITDEEYFGDDIVGLFCAWLKKVYGEDTLEENLEFIANALGNKGKTIQRVKKLCGVDLKQYETYIDELGRVRNQIQHYKCSINGEYNKQLMAKTFSAIEFIFRDILGLKFEDYENIIEPADIDFLHEDIAANKARKKDIVKDFEKSENRFRIEYVDGKYLEVCCPHCGTESLALESNGKIKCKFCGEEFDNYSELHKADRNCITQYGILREFGRRRHLLHSRIFECPQCENDSMIMLPNRKWLCLVCGYEVETSCYCDECGDEMPYIDGICTTAISDTYTEDFKSLCPQCAKKYAEDEAYIGYELS